MATFSLHSLSCRVDLCNPNPKFVICFDRDITFMTYFCSSPSVLLLQILLSGRQQLRLHYPEGGLWYRSPIQTVLIVIIGLGAEQDSPIKQLIDGRWNLRLLLYHRDNPVAVLRWDGIREENKSDPVLTTAMTDADPIIQSPVEPNKWWEFIW